MLNAFFKVGNLSFKTFNQSFGYLTQEYTALATRVEKCSIGILEQLLWEHINDFICQFGRCKHLVIAKIGNARKHVGIIDAFEQTILPNPVPFCSE